MKQLHLIDGETPFADWHPVDDAALSALVAERMTTAPSVIRVDGRSGSGKTTFATRLSRVLDAPVVHVDDVSWWVHPVEWAALMRDHVVGPWLRGESIDWQPPAWAQRSRDGSIRARTANVLIVEGVGAGRRELDHAPGCVVWVQSDYPTAKDRGLDRDVNEGRTRAEAIDFWNEWEHEENPFLAGEKAWQKAAFAVLGTPPTIDDSVTWVSTSRAD